MKLFEGCVRNYHTFNMTVHHGKHSFTMTEMEYFSRLDSLLGYHPFKLCSGGFKIMKRRVCTNDADFQRANIFQRKLEVWVAGELSTVGKIESFTADSVKMIDGSYYLRMNCKFFMV